jgi:nicotinamidase-related amidase
MMYDIPFEPGRTAVLSMDMQIGVVAAYTGNDPGMADRAASVLRAARTAGVTVIHIQVGFRPGMPEVDARNPLFGAILRSPEHQQFFQGPAGAIHGALGPETGDIVIAKHRVSAFAGTDLEMILRAKGMETLVLLGIATSGVVLSTLLEASDADYRLIVVRDCCADREADLHNALLDKLFPRRGAVVTAAELTAALALVGSPAPAAKRAPEGN